MSEDLPEAIDATLRARQRHVEGQNYERTQQTTVFLYRTGEGDIDLGWFEGPIRVPLVGEAVTLWDTRAPLVVTEVCSHYGLGHPDNHQHVSVTVYVDVPK